MALMYQPSRWNNLKQDAAVLEELKRKTGKRRSF